MQQSFMWRSTLKSALITGISTVLLTGLLAHASNANTANAQQTKTGAATTPKVTSNAARSTPGNNAVSVQALKAAEKKQWQSAFDLASRSGDRATLKAVEWLYIRKNPVDSGPERIMNFVAANPDWPASRSLTRNAEAILASNSTPVEMVARHFNRFTPISAHGHVAFARLSLARGDQATAARSIRKAWTDVKLSSSLEKEIASRYRGFLRTQDHKDRMWALVMAQETNASIRAAGYISKGHVRAARVAQALIRRKSGAVANYKKLSANFRNHPPMLYAYARWHRRKSRHATALSLIQRAPASHAAQINPKQWFVEKRLAARFLAGPNNRKYWPAIYNMMAAHGFKSGDEYLEGEFLAGWYALRKLSNPNAAAVHFKRVAEASKTRTDATRGWYWLGRARAAKGETGRAKQAYQQAAASPTLFYGQMALEKLGRGNAPLNISQGKATADATARVRQLEIFRAAHQMAQASGTKNINSFMFPIARQITRRDEAASAISQLHSAAGYFPAVRLAKAFGSRKVDVDNWAYPVNALPNWRTIGNRVERAVILGLSRQESEFKADAGSHAGAKGFMQIMPGTGKLIARQYRIGGYRTSHLTSKPSLNVSMGEAYLGDLIKQFNGSYIMSFAGYNAGPGNAKKWIKAYGDPRTGQIDPLDWIISIPITETRKYVQKVMQNVHVYRTRLGTKKYAMSQDLNRGGSRRAGSGSGSTAQGCGGNGTRTIASLIDNC